MQKSDCGKATRGAVRNSKRSWLAGSTSPEANQSSGSCDASCPSYEFVGVQTYQRRPKNLTVNLKRDRSLKPKKQKSIRVAQVKVKNHPIIETVEEVEELISPVVEDSAPLDWESLYDEMVGPEEGCHSDSIVLGVEEADCKLELALDESEEDIQPSHEICEEEGTSCPLEGEKIDRIDDFVCIDQGSDYAQAPENFQYCFYDCDYDTLCLGKVAEPILGCCPLPRMPRAMTTYQLNILKNRMNCREIISPVTGAALKIWTFASSVIEDDILNFPLQERSFAEVPEFQNLFYFLEGFHKGIARLLQPRVVVLLSEFGADDFVSMAFSLVFYGTEIIRYFESGSMKAPKPGLRGGAKCHGCHKEGHIKRQCPEADKCSRCGSKEHKVKDCKKPKPKKPVQKGPRQQNTRAGKKANLVASALTQSLQEAQGALDAVKEQADVDKTDINDKIIEIVTESVEQALKVEREKEKILPDKELEIVKPVDPPFEGANYGVSFRTGTKVYINKQVKFFFTQTANPILKAYNFVGKLLMTRVLGIPARLIPKQTYPVCSDLKGVSGHTDNKGNFIRHSTVNASQYPAIFRILMLRAGLMVPIYEKQPLRLGGLVHSIAASSSLAEKRDVRLDYLAVGDLKHEDPLYAFYEVQGVTVTKVVNNNCPVGFFEKFLPQTETFVESLTQVSLPETKVSKEIFKNLTSFRISPSNTDESAKNAIKIGLTKCAAVNHSKNYIEQNLFASDGSDESLTRTYEALVAFREHLKEEQILRVVASTVAVEESTTCLSSPVVVTEEFKARALN